MEALTASTILPGIKQTAGEGSYRKLLIPITKRYFDMFLVMLAVQQKKSFKTLQNDHRLVVMVMMMKFLPRMMYYSNAIAIVIFQQY
jgi:BarA-like signal transduction histidine kinase